MHKLTELWEEFYNMNFSYKLFLAFIFFFMSCNTPNQRLDLAKQVVIKNSVMLYQQFPNSHNIASEIFIIMDTARQEIYQVEWGTGGIKAKVLIYPNPYIK